MERILKLVHTNIKLFKFKYLKTCESLYGFTLLEVMMTIVIMSIFIGTSFGFLKYGLNFFRSEEAYLITSFEEKIALTYFVKDLFSANDIEVNANILTFTTFFKNKKEKISYKLYNSVSGQVLGRKKGENFLPVINNVKFLKFSRKKELIKIELKLIDSLGRERRIIKLIVPRTD